MATQIRNGFLSPQIWASKRKKQVIEVFGKLSPAHVEYAENIFSGEKYLDANGQTKRDYSLIPLIISDGTGSSRKVVKYNFNPNDFFALRRECEGAVIFHRSYERKFEKMNCIDGQMTIRSITIRHEYYKKDRNGKEVLADGQKVVSQYPWFIGISETKGKADAKGEKVEKVSEKNQSYILLSSGEYQDMIDSTCRYIDVYAMTFGAPLLREKRKQDQERREKYRKEQGKDRH